ncbi:MAG: alginate export family protein, partial [Tannerella sp.]|nr:alginate export family protein [Tannerella sp.]
MKNLTAILLGLLIGIPGFSQTTENKDNEFSMNAQLRPRAEYRNGVLFPHDDGAEAAGFINNRARISMDYKRDKLGLGFSVQQVGVWGQDPQVAKTGRMMLSEAWANLNLGDGFFMKLGRQALAYDDDRILGTLDWHVSGRHHDALKMGYENAQNKLHLILAFNQNGD